MTGTLPYRSRLIIEEGKQHCINGREDVLALLEARMLMMRKEG